MWPHSWASRRQPSAPTSPAVRCPQPTVASVASPSGGLRRSANGTASDRAKHAARSQPDSRDQPGGGEITAMHCRIEPFIDQGGALRAPRAGASARPLPRKARPGTRRPQAAACRGSAWHMRLRRPVPHVAVSSAVHYPARGRRVKSAHWGSRRMRSATRTLDSPSTRWGSASAGYQDDGQDQVG